MPNSFVDSHIRTFFLARHAAPQWGWPAPYNVCPGPPLSDLGRRQAVEVADFLATQGIAAIYTSPFARARETAEAVAVRLGCPPVPWPDLSEGGPGEGEVALRVRVLRGWAAICTGEYRGPVVVVTHGAPLRVILRALNDGRVNLDGYVFDYGNPAPPGGVWRAQHQGAQWDLALVFQPTESLREWEWTRDGRAFGAAVE